MPQMILMFKDKVLNVYPLHEGGALTIGRHPENDIVIQNLAVSSRHARIDFQDGQIRASDLNSKNGTFLEGAAVTQCILKDQAVLHIGKHLLRVDGSDTFAAESAAPHASSAVDPAQTMLLETEPEDRAGVNTPAAAPQNGRPAKDCLFFLSGGQGQHMLSRQIVIGKNEDADIVANGPFSLLMGAPAAIISKQAGDYFLRFTGGWIKPRRNGKSVKGTVKLKHDDIVRVGPVLVRIQLSGQPTAN